MPQPPDHLAVLLEETAVITQEPPVVAMLIHPTLVKQLLVVVEKPEEKYRLAS